MSPTFTFLWKESRENRATLIAIAALMLVAVTALFVVANPATLAGSSVPFLVAALGVLAVSLTLAPSVVPAEASGDGARFLSRLPISPGTVLRGKMLFLACCALGAATVGFAVGRVAQDLFLAKPDPLVASWNDLALLALPFFILGSWMLAISCWVPRALVVIPAIVVIAVVVGLPVHLALDARGLVVGRERWIVVWAIAAITPVILTAISWFGGTGRGDIKRGARRGVATLFVCTIPVWGWAGLTRYAFEVCDPLGPSVGIDGAFVSPDFKRAFLTVITGEGMGITYCVEADLERGTWRQVGEPGASYRSIAAIELLDGWDTFGPRAHVVQMSNRGEIGIVDTKTAALVRVLPPNKPSITIPDLLRADLRGSARFRDAAGHRVWSWANGFERERDDGSVEFLSVRDDAGSVRFPMFGGWMRPLQPGTPSRTAGRRSAWFDPVRFAYVQDDVQGRRTTWGGLVGGRWLHRFVGDDKRVEEWALVDPTTGAQATAHGIGRDDEVLSVVDSSRVLVQSGPTSATDDPRHELVDPATGAAVVLRDSAGRPFRGTFAAAGLDRLRPIHAPTGGILMHVNTSDGIRLARLDFDGVVLVAGGAAVVADGPGGDGWRLRPLACDSQDSVIVLVDGRQIFRLHFGDDRCELLWPRRRE